MAVVVVVVDCEDVNMEYGPNMMKLIGEFVSVCAVPSGGGLEDALKFFTDPVCRKRCLQEAEKMAVQAVNLVISAPDNPHGDDVEVIAGVIEQELKNKRWERLNEKFRKIFE